MAEITAAAVKALREKTGLPMMDCKKALTEADGNEDKAIELLRKAGAKLNEKRADRETAFGRFGIYCGTDKSEGGIVELKCESAPVTKNDEFIQLAQDLAEAVAKNESIDDAEKLLDLESPSKPGMTLREQKDELFNRIREVFKVGRIKRFSGGTGGYSHNSGTISGVLVAVDGGNDEVAKDVSMHIAAMRPAALAKEDLDSEIVDKEREILRAAAIKDGKPEKIVDKIVEGQLRSFFADRVLLEQPFVKDGNVTVGNFAESNGMKIRDFVHWELGVDSNA